MVIKCVSHLPLPEEELALPVAKSFPLIRYILCLACMRTVSSEMNG